MNTETREQHNALEILCEEHGECRVFHTLTRPMGRVMHVLCEDGTAFDLDEDGEQI